MYRSIYLTGECGGGRLTRAWQIAHTHRVDTATVADALQCCRRGCRLMRSHLSKQLRTKRISGISHPLRSPLLPTTRIGKLLYSFILTKTVAKSSVRVRIRIGLGLQLMLINDQHNFYIHIPFDLYKCAASTSAVIYIYIVFILLLKFNHSWFSMLFDSHSLFCLQFSVIFYGFYCSWDSRSRSKLF